MANAKASEAPQLKAEEFWSQFVQPRVAHIQNVSPLDSAEFVEHARQTLDTELDAMTWAICHLRMRRNSLSLISSLPPELLARIFHFSAGLMPPSRNIRTHPGPLGWIRLTHVCKHWRDTALQHPSLWGDIYPGLGARWRTLLLARAKSGPLSLSFPSLKSGDIHLISDHLSQIRHLSLSTSEHDVLKEASQQFTSSATILSSLKLHTRPMRYRGNVVLPEKLFSGNTPMLRHFQLGGVLLPWSSPLFSNLTSLHVTHHPPGRLASNRVVENTSASQYDSFFDALARMPNLEMLRLDCCFPQRSRESPAHKRVTVLSHLKQLFMRGPSAECIDVLTQFKIPSSCKLKLFCLQGSQPPLDSFLPFIGAFSRGAEEPLQTLLISSFDRVEERSVDIKLWRTCDAVDADLPTYHLYNSECDIRLHFRRALGSPGPLEALCQVLPLDDLRVLSVNGQYGSWSGSWSAQSWIDMFGRCRAVERVDVNHGIAVQFCKALVLPVGGNPIASGAPQMADQLFLRNLRALTISSLNFSDAVDEEDNELFIDQLIFLLRQRAEYCQNAISAGGSENNVEAIDRRLASLIILSCSIRQSQLSDLAELVQEIVWNNNEGDYGVAAEPGWDIHEHEDTDSENGEDEDEDDGSAGSQADSDISEGF